MYVGMNVCRYVCMYVLCMYYTCMYIYVHKYQHFYVIYRYVYHVCKYVYIYIHTHTHDDHYEERDKIEKHMYVPSLLGHRHLPDMCCLCKPRRKITNAAILKSVLHAFTKPNLNTSHNFSRMRGTFSGAPSRIHNEPST